MARGKTSVLLHFFFQAFSLYNANIEENSVMKDDQVCRDMWRVLSSYLFGSNEPKGKNGTAIKKGEFFSIVKNLRRALTDKRDFLKQSVSDVTHEVGRNIHEHPQKLIKIVSTSNDMMASFAGTVIDEAVKFLPEKKAPCDFTAIGIGSLGRGEATPYSDLEYLFLIEKAEHRPYFEKLAVLTYCIIGALNETKLNSVAICELNGDSKRDVESGWFVDGRQYGYQIDGITSTSDNVPTRAKELWRLKDSGGFIATPEDLLREYKEVLENPDDEALKGDITAMLMFTKLLYAVRNGKSQNDPNQENWSEVLLSTFERGRNELNCQKNSKRQSINLQMLTGDLGKFVFHPEYDLYSSGFNMNVKTELYRFPSILLLDLTTFLDDIGTDSWNTLQRMSGRFANFALLLTRLLAFACFSRLRCYLAADAHAENFRIGGQRAFPSGVGDGDQNIGYRVSNTWEMSRDEFFILCRDLVTLQQHLSSRALKTSSDVTALMEIEIPDDPFATTLAYYYCCEWSEVIDALDGFYWTRMVYQHRIALAFSFLKVDDPERAFYVLDALRYDIDNDKKHGKKVETDVQINVLRLLAKSVSLIEKEGIKLKGKVCVESVDPMEEEGRKRKHKVPGNSAARVEKVKIKPTSKVRRIAVEQMSELTFATLRSLPTKERQKLRRVEAMALFEHSLYLSKQRQDKSKASKLLVKTLALLILDAGTSPKCGGLQVLNNFESLRAIEMLKWVGNGTRELAHCLYTMATLFEDKETARRYFKKAEHLGLEFFIRFGTDNYTQIMILTDLGKALDNKQYLRGALALLERSCGKKDQSELKTEIMVSIVECIGPATDEVTHSVELENQLELELNRVITDTNAPADDGEDDETEHDALLHSNRTDNWYSRAIKALKDIPTDMSKEDAELLKNLREKFGLAGKDTKAFDEKLDAAKPKKCDIATQTNPPQKTTVMTASVQTNVTIAHNQTFGDANVQTDAVDKLDREAQTDVTTGPSRDEQTQTNPQPDLPSVRGKPMIFFPRCPPFEKLEFREKIWLTN